MDGVGNITYLRMKFAEKIVLMFVEIIIINGGIIITKIDLSYLDSTLFDWLKWRGGSIKELGLLSRYLDITSSKGKSILKKYVEDISNLFCSIGYIPISEAVKFVKIDKDKLRQAIRKECNTLNVDTPFLNGATEVENLINLIATGNVIVSKGEK